MSTTDLLHKTEEFAASIEKTLNLVLPGQHALAIVKDATDSRAIIRPPGKDGWGQLPLLVGGEHLASLRLSFKLTLDHRRHHLKVVASTFSLLAQVERVPLLRLEFLEGSNRSPAAHWQFHADRGAFSHLLARAHAVGPKKARTTHDLSKVHLPLGGTRFRPCLEDFLEMLIVDCGIDAKRTWRAAVSAGRRDWRERQLAAIVRDAPESAAESLSDLGWTVTPPKGYKQKESVGQLLSW